MQILCRHCEKEGKKGVWIEEKLYPSHLLLHEGAIERQALDSLQKITERVEYLLKKFPQCRSNDKILLEKFWQYFTPIIIYDAENGRIKSRNPEGITFDEWLALPHFESIGRARRALQSKYPELKGSEKVEVLRGMKETAYHDRFASERVEA